MTFDEGGENRLGQIGRSIAENVRGRGRSGGGRGGGNGGGGVRSIFENVSSVADGMSSILNLSAPPTLNFDENNDKSVKFNPLVHYYHNSYTDEDEIEKKEKYQPLPDYTYSTVSKPTQQEQLQRKQEPPPTYKYNYYRVSDRNLNEEIKKEQTLPLRSLNTNANLLDTDEQQQLGSNLTQIIKVPNYSTISIITPPLNRSDKFVQTHVNDANSNSLIDTYQLNSDPTGFYQHLRPATTTIIAPTNNSYHQMKYKKVANNYQKGIVLKPPNIYHESNTDDILNDFINSYNSSNTISTGHSHNFNNHDNGASLIPPHVKVTVVNTDKLNDDNNESSSTSTNTSTSTPMMNSSNIATTTVTTGSSNSSSNANTTIAAGLARNESFYLTEFSNVKL